MKLRRTTTTAVLATLAVSGGALAYGATASAQDRADRTPDPGMARMHERMLEQDPGMVRMHERMLEQDPAMARMHQRMLEQDPAMARMHQRMLEQDPAMARMHQRMSGGQR